MTHDEHQSCGDTLPTHYDAVLFDLDGVVTKTASVHAAAWKRSFDTFLKQRAADTGQAFVPFDIEADYRRYVGGSSLNCYRNSSASTCTSYRGHSLELALTRDALTVSGHDHDVVPIKLGCNNEVYEFAGGSTRVFKLG